VSRPSTADVRPRRRVYVDTSAYLCILLGEEGSERLSATTEGAELVSSVLLVLEGKRNLVRLAREGALRPDQYQVCLDRLTGDQAAFVLRDLTLDLCVSNLMPAVSTPRSLDLAHLRTALWFHAAEPLTRFLSTDTALTQAADELGLPV
jgi:predicted nucleic acid-binding protein